MARQVSRGRSVKVTVPSGFGSVKAGVFYEISGFLGMAANAAQEAEQVVLLIEQAEYETSQIDAAATVNPGDRLYWDAANRVFTTTDGGGFRVAGIVTQGKDANGAICFVLGPQV